MNTLNAHFMKQRLRYFALTAITILTVTVVLRYFVLAPVDGHC